jgi:MoxR-like ATPase
MNPTIRDTMSRNRVVGQANHTGQEYQMQRGSTLEQLPLGADAQRAAVDKARQSLGGIILGKDREIALALACLLARGHLLIEDLPGLGKTILAQSLASVLGLSFQRIQFTSDLLPADIVGVSIFQQQQGEFRFQPGPIFAQLVLADEVNRATPKAQSALLEAMEEHQVSVDGKTHKMPTPYFVVATQNPSDQIGTFPLPESQLDRFLMRLELGYPNEESERALITGIDRRELLSEVEPALNADILLKLQETAAKIHMTDPLIDYVQALVRFTRESPDIETGLSPRGSLALVAAARSHAFIEHHSGVFPDDVQAIFAAVAGHRLKAASNSSFRTPAELSRHVLDSVAIP